MTDYQRFACPCCGYLTLTEMPPGTHEVCPVCYWEDDAIQYHDPTYEGGANAVSLTAARATFQSIGACASDYIDSVRKPLPSERP